VLLITHNVEEAIHMADRVIVLYERPTKIKSIFEIPFRHPRNMSSPEAQELKRSILRELGFTDQVDSESKNAADPITRRTKAVQFDDAEV
jgi:ABC-type nitrate/sulfonate/bicarbonate transport system ATPase subunit